MNSGFFSTDRLKLSLLIGLNVDDLLAVVKAANLAYAVRLHNCVTSRVGALAHAGHGELAVVRASLISAGFRYFFLWYCHIYTSSCTHALGGAEHNMFLLFFGFCIVVKQGTEDREPRIDLLFGATAIAEAKRLSALGAKTETIVRAENAHRKG